MSASSNQWSCLFQVHVMHAQNVSRDTQTNVTLSTNFHTFHFDLILLCCSFIYMYLTGAIMVLQIIVSMPSFLLTSIYIVLVDPLLYICSRVIHVLNIVHLFYCHILFELESFLLALLCISIKSWKSWILCWMSLQLISWLYIELLVWWNI